MKLDIDFVNDYKQLGVFSKFCVFNLPNILNHNAPLAKRLLCSIINKCNKEFQNTSKALNRTKFILSEQLSHKDFCILKRSITLPNKKVPQKSLNTQQKKLSLLTRNRNLTRFKANETITDFTQHKLSQEASDLLKAGL